MASRNFYIQLILRVTLMSLTAVGMALALAKSWYLLLVMAVLLLVVQAFLLISYINSTNRKIAYFFDAIKNEDFTLRFPEKVSIESFKELNRSLNRVNGLIQEVHLQLQIREQYYQQILKQASIGIMTYNEKGHILFSNPTLEQLLNYRPLNHIKQLEQIDPKLYALFAGLQPFDRKLFQLSNEREKIQLALKATSLSLDGKSLLLVTVQDIHKELDEKETDSWVRLIRVLTHEIMNTITPITSISESILKYYRERDGASVRGDFSPTQIDNTVKGLEVIKEQGSDLMQFVQSYRSFLNLPPPDKALVPAHKLLDRFMLIMDGEHKGKNIHFEADTQPPDLELFVDEKQISQVLINLGRNAIQALEGQGSGWVKIIAEEDGQGRKRIQVRDNGPGIPPGRIEEVFVPFFTTKEGGTGIGLSLSKQIMRLHGGNLNVHSTPGVETSFTLLF